MAASFPTFDVLVLGAGLAGLHAAIAACEARPGARVAVACLDDAPSGSSFANRNARLGVLAPRESEADAVHARIMELAAPGCADPALARILVDESLSRMSDLEALGANLDCGALGTAVRHASCFGGATPLALLLTDLPGTYGLLSAKAKTLGAEILTGLEAFKILLSPEGQACGAAFLNHGTGEIEFVRAGATVMALGGPASLFEHNISGPGVPGTAYGMLAEAGAELLNTAYIQFFWCTLPDRTFFHVHTLASPGAGTLDFQGELSPLPEEVISLAPQRSTHCPMSHGQPDAALDRALIARLDDDATLEAITSDGTRVRIAPHAHSGNGGARIDSEGATTVPGLFAAGECASGMHGADRLGGALAAQAMVFGTRAGSAATLHAREAQRYSEKLFTELTKLNMITPLSNENAPRSLSFPIPADAMLSTLNRKRYHLKLIEQNILINLLESNLPPHNAALLSALTVVRNLHTIT